MDRLHYQLECLWGNYAFEAEFDEKGVKASTGSNIEGFDDKEINIEGDEFYKLIAKAGIDRWEKEYAADDSRIDDACKWQIEYVKDGKTYRSKGEEAFWPYGYEEVVKAISLADEDFIKL